MEKLSERSERCANEEHVKYKIYCDKLIVENNQLRQERDCLRDQYQKVSTQTEFSDKRRDAPNDTIDGDGTKIFKTTHLISIAPKNSKEAEMKERYGQLEADYRRVLSEQTETKYRLSKSGEIIDDLRQKLRREIEKGNRQSVADDDVASNLKIMHQYVTSIKEISNKHVEAMERIERLEAKNRELNETLFNLNQDLRALQMERDHLSEELKTSQEKTTGWETSYLQLQSKFLKLNNSNPSTPTRKDAPKPNSEVDGANLNQSRAKLPIDKKLIREKYNEAFAYNFNPVKDNQQDGASYHQIVDKIKQDYNNLTSMLKEQSILDAPRTQTDSPPLAVEVKGVRGESYVETALRQISQINQTTTKLGNQIDEFRGGKDDASYAELTQALLENLLKIDMVEVRGYEIIRIRREHATKYAKDCLRRLEMKMSRRLEPIRPFRH